MTVGDLIDELQNFDDELDVVILGEAGETIEVSDAIENDGQIVLSLETNKED